MNYETKLVQINDNDVHGAYWRAIEDMRHQQSQHDSRYWLRNILLLPFPFCIGGSDDDPTTKEQLEYILAAVLMSGINKQDFWDIDNNPERYGITDEDGNTWHWKLRKLRNDGPEGHSLGNKMFVHLERRQRLTSSVRLFTNRQIRRFNLEKSKRLLIENIIAVQSWGLVL